jgi:restriction system protein
MAIPDYQACMLPLLRNAEDGTEHLFSSTIIEISDHFNLTQQERVALLPSGAEEIIKNRLGWARWHLKIAGLIQNGKRGYYQITQRGQELLAENPADITIKLLRRYPEFVQAINGPRQEGNVIAQPEEHPINMTPQESLEYGYQKLTENLVSDILENIKLCSPSFFEHLVVELLVKMGYGGSMREAASIVGKSGDAGIDGIIKEDKLGLDAIYIQAKRWDSVVGRPEIQKFAGALLGQKAKKGIFITTSTFTKEAWEFPKNIEAKIVLIDGEKLAELMTENKLGVSIVSTYEIHKVDTDYFVEE